MDAGPLERRRCQNRPPRCEYVPTMTGRNLRPVILALHAWGNKDVALFASGNSLAIGWFSSVLLVSVASMTPAMPEVNPTAKRAGGSGSCRRSVPSSRAPTLPQFSHCRTSASVI